MSKARDIANLASTGNPLDDGTLTASDIGASLSDSVAALTSAATVDIDLSSGTIFTLTPDVNTTFTLSNTTAVDSFTLTLTGGGVSGFALSDAVYSSVSFSVTSQDGSPNGLAFNTNGTKMYIMGGSTDTVYQYTLSTGFDLSTASYDSVSFSVTSQDGGPNGIAFNTDGTKMYILGGSSDSVYQYTLSTGFDLSTASYDSVSFSVNSQDSSPNGIAFNTDGTKMYMVGSSSDSVYQYTLSTGFDLSTASYDNVSLSASSQDSNPRSVTFSTDGTKMYMVGNTNNALYQYTLSTGFDLSTASYDSVSFSVASQDTTPLDIAFNTNGTKMYIMGGSSDTVYQYNTATPSTFTYPAAFKWSGGTAPDTPAIGEIDVITAFTVDSGTTWYATLTGDALA
jgi:sugar lactone lactonase YvrE